MELDKQYAILNYVAECPDMFDSMTGDEMVREVGKDALYEFINC